MEGFSSRHESNTTSSRGMYSANDETKLNCGRCSKMFRTYAGLKMHMQSHTGKWAFWCEMCKRGFTVKCNYVAHMAKHEGKTFPCDFCTKRFGTKFGLKQHQSEHTGQYMYNCGVCGRGYNQKLHWKNTKIGIVRTN